MSSVAHTTGKMPADRCPIFTQGYAHQVLTLDSSMEICKAKKAPGEPVRCQRAQAFDMNTCRKG